MEQLLQTAIASVGLAILISDYSGPFGIFISLRTSRLGRLFECPVCLLPYIVLLVLISPVRALEYLFVVGLGILIARWA